MKLTEYYKAMSHDQKVAFWTISSNVFLVVFTFWMGLFVQDFIADKNANLTKELVRYDYVDRIYPTYKIINSSEVLDSLWQYALENKILNTTQEQKRQTLIKAGNYIINNGDKLEMWAESMCSTLGDFKYYLKDKTEFDSISNNNSQILICLEILRLCKSDSLKTMTPKQFEDSLKSFLCSSRFRNTGVTSITTIETSKLGGELFKIYNECDSVTQNLFKQEVASSMINPILRNSEIINDLLSYSTKEEYKFRIEPWLYLIFSLIVGVIISLVIARFIISRQSLKSVSTLDYGKLEKRIRELEAFKILSEEERDRFKDILSEKEKRITQYTETIAIQAETINMKNAIINDDIEELRKLRDKIIELEAGAKNNNSCK